uniref:IBR domain-containing protein n=1 Tax=Panagrolaimus superbus TaxID=310955 RepID=A0A914Y672_9BILA
MFDKFKVRGIKLPNDNLKYKILSTDDVNEEINKLVEKCLEVIEEVSPQNCQKMICHFKWNCNKLLEKFYEADSFVHFLKKNNIDLSVPLTSEAMIDSFIQSNPLYKWCPNKSNGCTFVVKMDDDSEVEEIACQCGLTYCIQCYGIPHSPFPCILIHEWTIQLDEFKNIYLHNVIWPQLP